MNHRGALRFLVPTLALMCASPLVAEEGDAPAVDPAPVAEEAAPAEAEVMPVERAPATTNAPMPDTSVGKPFVPEGGVDLTKEEVERLALERAFDILASREEELAVDRDRRAAVSPFLPQVSGVAGYERTREFDGYSVPVQPATAFPGASVPFPGSGGNNYSAGGRVDQLIYTFGKLRATIDAAREGLAAARAGTEVTERDAVFDAMIALEEVKFARASLEVAYARLDQRQLELQDARDGAAAGTLSDFDTRQAEVNLQQIANTVFESQAQVDQAILELGRLLNLEFGTYGVGSGLERPADLDELMTKAAENLAVGADMQATEAEKRALEAQARLQTRNYLPNLGAFGRIGVAGDEFDDMEEDWGVGVTLNWNLYDGGGSWAQHEALLKRSNALGFRVDQILRARQRQLDGIKVDLESLEQRIKLLEETIVLAKANYEDARETFRAGSMTQTRLSEVGLAEVDARFALATAIFQEAVLAHQLEALAK